MISWLLSTFRNYFSGEEEEKKEEDRISRLPEHLNRSIIGRLDILSRLMLRKASGPFRELIDKNDLTIRKLLIQYTMKTIEVTIDNGFHVLYHDVGGGTLVKCDEEMKLLGGDDFVELFQRDLLTILVNQNLIIKNLKIVHSRRADVKIPEIREAIIKFDERIMNIFKNLGSTLNVKNLMITVLEPSEIKKVFAHLNPTFIQKMEFPRLRYSGQPSLQVHHFPVVDFFDSELVKNLDYFYSAHPIALADLMKITHCPFVNTRVADWLTLEHVQSILEALRENPNLDQWKLRGRFDTEYSDPRNRIIEFFHPGKSPYGKMSTWKPLLTYGKKRSICVTHEYAKFRGPAFRKEKKAAGEEQTVLSYKINDFELDFY